MTALGDKLDEDERLVLRRIRRKQQRRKHYESNREKCLQRSRQNYKVNRERRLQQSRQRYLANRENLLRKRSDRYYALPKSERVALSRKHLLKRKYGLTIDQFKEIWDSQGGKCANQGCKHILNFEQGKYRIDHCHKAGHVRGILCHKCNSAIGMLDNSMHKASGLLSYISREVIFNQ